MGLTGPVAIEVGEIFSRKEEGTMFSIDVSSLLSTASSIFSGLWPVMGVIAGLALGFSLLAFVVKEIRQAL